MFSICKNFIKVNEDLFLIKRTFKEEYIKNVDMAKEIVNCQYVFKKDGIMYFCEMINELEIETELLPQS